MGGIRIPAILQPWIDARKRFHLSHAQIQMARELGLNPKKFGKLANYRQEPWKLRVGRQNRVRLETQAIRAALLSIPVI